MNNSENNENEILGPILIKPMLNFLTIGFIVLFAITYFQYASGKWPLWVFILVSLLNILWNIFYPLSCYKSLIENKNILKKMFLCYLAIIICIILASVICVNAPFLVAPLIILLLMIAIIGILHGLIFFGFIVTFSYVCIEGYPLWLIILVLVITILYLVFGILFTPKADRKDRKRLLLWGGLGGILFVGIILTLAFLNIQIPLFLRCLAFPIGYFLGSKFGDKKL